MTSLIKYSEPKSEAGFTLVEVLISLFIFALISAGTLGAMFQTFAAKERLDVAATELADVAAFRAILRADMDALTLRPMRDGLGGVEPTLVTTDGEALLTFTRLGRTNPSGATRGQAERVRYILRDGKFIRESLLHENPAQMEGWRGRVLLEDVQTAELRYLSRAVNTDIILENWSVLNNGQPVDFGQNGAVELTLTTARGAETAHLFEVGL